MVKIVDGEAPNGKIYELGGPDIMSFKEIMQFVLRVTGRKRMLVNLPYSIANIQATFMEMLPKPMLTRDQIRLLQSDNVVSEAARSEGRTLEALGISGSSVEAIVPSYLYRFRKAGQFEKQNAG